MAHQRPRKIEKAFHKALKFWPAVSFLGPRQSGKSTFLRDLAWKTSPEYFVFDRAAIRRLAEANPELFLSQVNRYPVVFDEVQKAPSLIDEIKSEIDKKRIPGRYVLAGSVKFSKKIGIRESLTGRTATLYMDTMTMLETEPNQVNLVTVQKYLELGGMPGVCFARDKSVRSDYWEQWLDTTCERDLRMFSKGRLSGDLARGILEQISTLEIPDQASIAAQLRVDGRRIRSHLDALENLLIVRRLSPSRFGVGKEVFLPFDCGLAFHLGAPLRRRWQIWFMVEFLNQRRFSSKKIEPLFYYRTQRGSFIDFVHGYTLYLFTDLPTLDRSCEMTIDAAKRKIKQAEVTLFAATGHPEIRALPYCVVKSWTSLVDLFS